MEKGYFNRRRIDQIGYETIMNELYKTCCPEGHKWVSPQAKLHVKGMDILDAIYCLDCWVTKRQYLTYRLEEELITEEEAVTLFEGSL